MKKQMKYTPLVLLLVPAILFLTKKKETPEEIAAHHKRPLETKVAKANAETELASPLLSTKETVSSPVNAISQIALSPELEKELDRLPQTVDMTELSDEEVHDTPDSIEEAGATIGKILEQAQNDPALRPQTMSFFVQCAESESVVDPIRALCWNKALVKIPEWDIYVPVSEIKIPKRIQSLASSIE